MYAYDKDNLQRETLMHRVEEYALQLERDRLIDSGMKLHVCWYFKLLNVSLTGD